MKTRVLALALCAIFGASIVSAQNLKFDWVDQPTKNATTDEALVEHYSKITNTSSSNISLRFFYNNSQKHAKHGCNICFNDFCYFLFSGPDDPNLREPTVLAPGETSSIKIQLITCQDPETFEPCPGFVSQSTVSFRVYDMNNLSDSVFFAVTFVIDVTNSVRDIADVMDVSVGPNPASDIVTLSAQGLSNVIGVDVYDNAGSLRRSVVHNGTDNITVPVDGLSSGLHHVVLTFTNGDVYRQPISIVR
ncbi:MAG TPA: hypothetical protein DIS79_03300 [Bacteroidetes bacterium]|nr:hypothetical protein [Bacteroidota bacterium]HRK05744.1 T9SS type A sorting domain-containing protein [Chlorobiota bacterium]